MYLINVWDREELLFKGKTETEPKIDMNEKFYSVKTNEAGKVVEHKFKPARYRITYEDI
jgi:hypothetical protein|tara:strand:+ start:21 stop:197 length:177 start_codon:yes stop_codon:yes gene_type:complete